MRHVPVYVGEIIDLIHCAEVYGFMNDVLMSAFGDFLEHELSDQEINNYITQYEIPIEDSESVRSLLTNFKEKYCNRKQNFDDKTTGEIMDVIQKLLKVDSPMGVLEWIKTKTD